MKDLIKITKDGRYTFSELKVNKLKSLYRVKKANKIIISSANYDEVLHLWNQI